MRQYGKNSISIPATLRWKQVEEERPFHSILTCPDEHAGCGMKGMFLERGKSCFLSSAMHITGKEALQF